MCAPFSILIFPQHTQLFRDVLDGLFLFRARRCARTVKESTAKGLIPLTGHARRGRARISPHTLSEHEPLLTHDDERLSSFSAARFAASGRWLYSATGSTLIWTRF
jgi:hypothetical protein